MAKKSPKKFDDPLKDVDPVMEKAFSSDLPGAKKKKGTTRRKSTASADAPAAPAEDIPNVSQIDFPSLSPEEGSHVALEEGVFSNIPVKVSVELGRSTLSLKEVYELCEGSLIELERLVGEPLALLINNQVIAHGEVVAIDNKYGLRIKSLVSQSSR